jgi:hypothetical protein
MRVADQVAATRELIEKYRSSIEQRAIIVLTKDRIRVRLMEPGLQKE